RDWSSDVCSSDLAGAASAKRRGARGTLLRAESQLAIEFRERRAVWRTQLQLRQLDLNRGVLGNLRQLFGHQHLFALLLQRFPVRSEERRVGKECRSWWSSDH